MFCFPRFDGKGEAVEKISEDAVRVCPGDATAYCVERIGWLICATVGSGVVGNRNARYLIDTRTGEEEFRAGEYRTENESAAYDKRILRYIARSMAGWDAGPAPTRS